MRKRGAATRDSEGGDVKHQLKRDLEGAIREWVDANVEGYEWPDCYLGEATVPLMTEAAAAVFDAVVEVQEYAIHEGLLEETKPRSRRENDDG